MTSPVDKFDFGTRLGIFLSVEASLLSAISVAIVLCYIGTRRVKKIRARRRLGKVHANIGLPPLDATDSLGFVNLMIAEFIQALGGLLNLRWVANGFIAEGTFCTVQGRMKQIGDVGVALFSLVIAFDTFFVLSFGWRARKRVASWSLIGVGLFIIMCVAVGSGINSGKTPPYYGNTTYWCWIRPEYKTERIVFEYLWMWIAAFVMLILYGCIALVMRGHIVVEGKRMRLRSEDDKRATRELGRGSHIDSKDEQASKLVANMMLFYPAIYICCVLPVSIVRWLDFSGHSVSAAATIFSSIVFSLSGLFNVLLFKFTRPSLISGHNLDPPSNPDLTGSMPLVPGHHQKSPSGTGGTTYLPTGFGMLPDDPETPSPVNATLGSESSAARYAQAHTKSQSTSSSGTRPRTQESLMLSSRDKSFGDPGLGSSRATGLGHLPE